MAGQTDSRSSDAIVALLDRSTTGRATKTAVSRDVRERPPQVSPL